MTNRHPHQTPEHARIAGRGAKAYEKGDTEKAYKLTRLAYEQATGQFVEDVIDD